MSPSYRGGLIRDGELLTKAEPETTASRRGRNRQSDKAVTQTLRRLCFGDSTVCEP